MQNTMPRFISILFIIITSFLSALASDSLSWKNISIGNGAVTVRSLYRADGGVLWIGTDNGLYSYSGYQAHRCDPDNNFGYQVYSIVDTGNIIYLGTNNGLRQLDVASGVISEVPGNFPTEIRTMALHDGHLWIGALSGLYDYDISAGKILRSSLKLPHQAVYAVTFDYNEMYIGTYGGLCRYNVTSGQFDLINLGRDAIFVNSLAIDQDSHSLYVGTEGSLLRYDIVARCVKEHYLDGNSVKSLAIMQNALVAGTDDGLYVINGDDITVYRHNSTVLSSISNNVIWCLFIDDEGNLFAGNDTGLSEADPGQAVRVISIFQLTGRSDGNQIYSFLRDGAGNLWIGGSNGLIRLNNNDSAWYMPGSSQNYISHNRIRDIFASQNGNVWVATDGSLNRYNPATHNFDNFHIKSPDGSMNANWCYNVVEDDTGSLWVGSFLGGVMQVNPDDLSPSQTAVARHVICEKDGFANNLVNRLAIDRNNSKWVLLFRDSTIMRVSHRGIEKIDIKATCGNFPTMFTIDRHSDVWVGAGSKIVKIDNTSFTTKVYELYKNDGDEYISAMCPVGDNIWIVSSNGVWALDSSTGYATLVPVPSKPYTAVYHDLSTGRVLLGANSEIVSVDPSIVGYDNNRHEIKVMRLTLNGQETLRPYFSGSELNKITINSASDVVRIEFSTLDLAPDHIGRLAYRIPGIIDNYTLLDDGQNSIKLPSLAPGSYTLEVRYCDSDSAVLSIPIDVLQPWYLRWYAIIGYILILALVAFQLIRVTKRREQRAMEQRERDNTMAGIRRKIDFLTNISHDLKTPLSMIIGPVSHLRQDATDAHQRHTLDVIYNNALKINEMIHKTVEVDRLDIEKETPLIMSKVNVVEFVKSIIDSYTEAHPELHFVFTSSTNEISTEWDAVKMESVLNNLLSNACKYTSNNATIGCSVEIIDNKIEIKVSDDGYGIPEAEQALVFQRMFRSTRTADIQSGTGIGLYLVRQYVEMHGGNVSLESRENIGTTFTVTLPWHAAEANKSDSAGAYDFSAGLAKVLIVEDNLSIADFIKDILSPGYDCQIASNGRAALALLSTFRPDLIITDEMMPIMSGLEMCRRIKAMPAFASIPIIMITAKDDNATETGAVKLGIDNFLTKPFEAPLLLALVARKLESREEIKKSLRIEQITETAPIVAESQSEKQLDAVTRAIEKYIDDSELNVNFLCEKTGYSSKQLYRLIKKYIGVTPVEYIRQIRMKKAAMLLKNHGFTVSEVMYMVGFSSPSYFSKCFAAQYGCTPSKYKGE